MLLQNFRCRLLLEFHEFLCIYQVVVGLEKEMELSLKATTTLGYWVIQSHKLGRREIIFQRLSLV